MQRSLLVYSAFIADYNDTRLFDQLYISISSAQLVHKGLNVVVYTNLCSEKFPKKFTELEFFFVRNLELDSLHYTKNHVENHYQFAFTKIDVMQRVVNDFPDYSSYLISDLDTIFFPSTYNIFEHSNLIIDYGPEQDRKNLNFLNVILDLEDQEILWFNTGFMLLERSFIMRVVEQVDKFWSIYQEHAEIIKSAFTQYSDELILSLSISRVAMRNELHIIKSKNGIISGVPCVFWTVPTKNTTLKFLSIINKSAHCHFPAIKYSIFSMGVLTFLLNNLNSRFPLPTIVFLNSIVFWNKLIVPTVYQPLILIKHNIKKIARNV
jgi:hypothetical protein